MLSSHIRQVVAGVARKWSRKIPWVSCEDVEQHIWEELLSSKQLSPSYAQVVAQRSARRFVAKNSVPVSGSVREAAYRAQLLSVVSVALEATELQSQQTAADDELHKLRIERLVRTRLVELLGQKDTVFLLLGQQFSPRELADHYNTTARAVSDKLWRLQCKCRSDFELQLLWGLL